MKQDYHHIYETCKQHMHGYVLVEMRDGSNVDGIITGLDDEYVYLAVPLAAHEMGGQSPVDPSQGRLYPHNPGFGYGAGSGFSSGYGYPGGYGGHGYPGSYPPRRFRRLILPLVGLTALSLLPWY